MTKQPIFRSLKAAIVSAVLLFLVLAVGATSAHAAADGAATVTASALNMRSNPSTSGSIVTTLPRGTVVLVTDDSQSGWYKVWYKGYEGYMSASYLSVSDSADSAFGTGTIKGTDVRVRSGPGTSYSILGSEDSGKTMSVTGVSGVWYKVSYNGSTGYVHSTYMTLSNGGSSSSGSGSSSGSSSSGSTASGTGTINAYYVRMRSGPSTSYSILGTYNKGTEMTITGSTGDWYKVRYNGTDGYVYKTYLTMQSGDGFSVTDMDDTAAVVTGAVHMRTGPSTSYQSLRVLGSGTKVTITGSSGKWYRVSYNGSTGYIFKSYLSTDVTSSSGSASTGTSAGQALVAEGKKYLGVPYVWAGTSPSGFDCSGFVYYVYKQCGYSITRTATAQNTDGYYVSRSDLQPGDIVIFYNSAMTSIGHSGIYIGDGQFIHASSGAGKVVISNLSSTYYNTHYYSARRVVS